MSEELRLLDVNLGNLNELGLCGYKNPKKEGFPEKASWLGHQFTKGLRIISLWSEKDGSQGMIEFTPGEQAWRPVQADNTLFIHCLFVGFKKEYKKQGYASMMIEACIEEAKRMNKQGVTTVCRDGSFMADKRIFQKNGFQIADESGPDFQLLFLPLKASARLPRFNHSAMERSLNQYRNGVYILRSDQCPYSVKNVREMGERAEELLTIRPIVMTICSALEAQKCPSPFGTFCIIADGQILAHHPVSATRFITLLRKHYESKSGGKTG